MPTWLTTWYEETVSELIHQFRWSFLPPLMVYFAAGISGLTAIVGTFFVKEYLGLSAAYLAGLAFWAGLPWALKMPLGHLVDVIWRWKALLVYLGAALIAASLLIMFCLIEYRDQMAAIMPVASWFVMSALLAPAGYVIQDAVADAMSVEAVPRHRLDGSEIDEATSKQLHTTMQTLGRIALITGSVGVALLNIVMFEGVETLSTEAKADVYANIYLTALFIPLVSVSGVILAAFLNARRRRQLLAEGHDPAAVDEMLNLDGEKTTVNPWYFIGGAGFVALSLAVGIGEVPFAQEIVFAGSMAIVITLMTQLARELPPGKAYALFGTAIIVFIFRAVPLPGPGATWFTIDVLKFDQQFLSVLSLIASVLTLAGMLALRPYMARKSIVDIVILLTIAAGILSLPNIALYYGVQDVTAPLTWGVVDARFIAIIDTAVESPLGQIAMIPMLTWIAKNAPSNLKATFFAVMASFTNLALSASSLLTRYLNEFFIVTREVKNRETGVIEVPADYSMLGYLLITVALIGVAAPLIAIFVVQRSKLRTPD
jgi:hypothetical protein